MLLVLIFFCFLQHWTWRWIPPSRPLAMEITLMVWSRACDEELHWSTSNKFNIIDQKPLTASIVGVLRATSTSSRVFRNPSPSLCKKQRINCIAWICHFGPKQPFWTKIIIVGHLPGAVHCLSQSLTAPFRPHACTTRYKRRSFQDHDEDDAEDEDKRD